MFYWHPKVISYFFFPWFAFWWSKYSVLSSCIANHFTLYISYLGMNYSNIFGYLIVLVFILQFISGILLSSYYSPFYTIAFDSVFYLMIDVKYGWLIRWYHVIGASLFIFLLLLHFSRGAWLRLKVSYMEHSSVIWYSGWLLVGFSLIECFLGYILNWGQMSYWGVTVMMNILDSFCMVLLAYLNSIVFLPIGVIAEAIWCSIDIIINRIFVAHFVTGFLIGLFIILHLYILHGVSSSNPLFNTCSSLMIPFYPFFSKSLRRL